MLYAVTPWKSSNTAIETRLHSCPVFCLPYSRLGSRVHRFHPCCIVSLPDPLPPYLSCHGRLRHCASTWKAYLTLLSMLKISPWLPFARGYSSTSVEQRLSTVGAFVPSRHLAMCGIKFCFFHCLVGVFWGLLQLGRRLLLTSSG